MDYCVDVSLHSLLKANQYSKNQVSTILYYSIVFHFKYYALFENVKEQFGEIGADNPTYNGEFFDNIGNIVLGMTGEDINNLPEDTELLTIIDILSKYEDEMDSSQVTQTFGQVHKHMLMQICNTRHFKCCFSGGPMMVQHGMLAW